MNYRTIGNSVLRVSETSFGCMSLLKTSAGEAADLVRLAIDSGINFFDTADLYDKGANEELIGKLLKPLRSKILIATKVGNQWKPDGSGWAWNPTKSYILKAVDESLRRLQTDYIDLYQLHGGTIEDPTDETIDAFEQLVAAGKIRYYGISSIRPNVIRAYIERSNIVSVMLQYSVLDRRPEETVLDLLQSAGKGVLVRGALAQGLLAGKLPKNYLEQPASTVQTASDLIQAKAHLMHTIPAVLAREYVLSHPAVSSVVTGIRTLDQLHEAVVPMPATDGSWISALQTAIPAQNYKDHR